ncbi:UBN2 domain-containing protein [Tanacetum coccineum]
MTLYIALPRKEYERVFMCKIAKKVWHTLIITHKGNSQVKNCKIDLLTQEYEKFLISNEETIDSGFTGFGVILIGNLQVYEMILASDGVASTPIEEKVLPIALKANVTRGQTSNDSVCQDGSDEDKDEDKEEEFNRGRGNRSKGVGSSRGKRNCYGCGNKNHFVDDCLKAKMKKAFFGGAVEFGSDCEAGDNREDAICLMAINSQR